jgi:Ca2+-binding EF-hand superfamily protein
MIMKERGNNTGKESLTRMLGLSAVLLVVTASPLATASYADDAQQSEPSAAFLALDQNKDGKLTAVEVRTEPELSQRWTQIDKDENGAIDEAEFSAFEAMQPQPSEVPELE